MTLFDQPWTLFAVLFVVLLVLVEIGYRIGSRLSVATDGLRHEQLVASRDAISVLLSLLLGFTLAMALSRFDQRKQLIVDEANAIGTTTRRAQMLPDPARGEMLDSLRQYVDERIRFSVAELHSAEFEQSVARGKQLQNEMWRQGVEVAKQSPTPITSLFVQALNESMDLSEKRMAALENRVPGAIWVMLTLISLLTCLTVGMSVRRRFWFVMALTPLMIAIVMALIADLNSPRKGFIQIGRQSMERVQQDLKSPENHR
jgi:Protein of unknown function (DUF4239)